MDNFVFSLNATIPIFLVMVLGYILMRVKFFTEDFVSVVNKYVFKVALPVLLFRDIATTPVSEDFDIRFVVFCIIATAFMFGATWFFAWKFLPDKSMVGAFTQAAARGSAAVLGIAFVENIYGNSGLTPLMIISAVPFFNIYSVIILTLGASDRESQDRKGLVRHTLFNIITNPIILGILAGVPFSIIGVTLPPIVLTTADSIASTATPMALLAVGASFQGSQALARQKLKPTIAATIIKLFVLPAIITPLAVLAGFRDSALVAILIMSGSPTTVTCYIMAKNMHNDDVLTASVVMLATLLSSVSLTLWLFLFRSLGYI